MLQQLPTEILSSIFQELVIETEWTHNLSDDEPGDEDFRQSCSSLVSLCRTSRRLRSIAEPLLYQTYVKPNTVKTPLELKYIHGYLQTLLQRPDLARSVRNVCIKAWFQPGTLEHLLTDHVPEFWQWENLDRFPREPFLDDGTFEAFLSAEPIHDSQASTQLLSLYCEHLEKLDITAQERESWYQALEAGQEDAEITLLLSLTTNLDKLTLIMPNWEYFERPSSLPHFTRIIGSDLFLRNLTSICVRSNYTGENFHELDDYDLECYQGFPFSFLLPFLALPSLRSAYITQAFDLDIAEEYAPTGPFSSGLKSLKLSYCAMHPRVLQDVLSRCTDLEVFSCDMPDSNWPIYELSKAMHPHRASIRSLELDLCYWSPYPVQTDSRNLWDKPDDLYLNNFGFLREYTSLRHLTTSEDMLLRFSPDPMIQDLLPHQLEKLELTQCTASLVPSLEYLLEQRAEIMPELSEVRIERWYEDLHYRHRPSGEVWSETDARRRESGARMKRLRDAYHSASIEFSIW